MLAVVAERRRDGRSSFLQLVSYTILRDDVEMSETLSPERPFVRKSRSEEKIFNDLVGYATRNALPDSQDVIATFPDGRQQVRCDKVICETNCFSLATASTEMDMVAVQNTRCNDPVYHAILSWPESERPTPDQIFESARHCLKRLGMEGHQYVFAIHDDTDNLHCHLSVNRINPVSYKAASLYNDRFTLDRCCRELELKNGWKHDNGPYMVNDSGVIVRRQKFYKSAPAPARQLEHFGDKESLFSYAVDNCREKMDALFLGGRYDWDGVHDILISAGLELRQKGEGLAIYDVADDEQAPIKASDLHPELTLSCQQELIGAFTRASVIREVNRDGKDVLLSAVDIESQYDNRLHRRDKGARAERRNARAEARQDLIARYKAYKTSFVRPGISADVARSRFRELAASYRIRKNNVRMTERDPLLRKLIFRALEVEKMKDMAALRLQIRDERKALKAMPGYRPLSYRAWVEVQATSNDAAAISQLRGWAYREKRKNRTAAISDNIILHSVADDIRPSQIRGYDTNVNRDGAVVYSSGGKPVLLDRGLYIEVADAPAEKGKNLAMALHITGEKSGERVEVRGDKAFVQGTIQYIPHFNASSGKTVPLTHPVQRQQAGYTGMNRQEPDTTIGKKTMQPQHSPKPNR
ncbi:relaxase/mobilization nuclease domain-containing protein (plasmid) [Edwardsiella piscicida]|uniref:TraI/MobA(P) family conjugative relaxase n=1 Tax=Edwardsiella TaxID=635 RepID=UPI001F1D6ABD|nr:TraI/MobA(P) family conjugative relaxase [Edwardsiella piscicida]UJT80893.1 relaxase/mobilization nuclease domain-containing protein [Edwardsiella piscicida]